MGDTRGSSQSVETDLKGVEARFRVLRWWRSVIRHPKAQYWISPTLLVLFGAILVSIGGAPVLQSMAGETVRHGIVFCLLGLGAGIVVTTGQIDLSAIGVATISGVIFALICGGGGSDPGYFRIALAIATSLGFGTISGLLVAFCFHRLKVPMLIFSWALGAIYSIGAILLTAAAGSNLVADVSNVGLAWQVPGDFWAVGKAGFFISLGSLVLALFFLGAANLPQRAAALGASETSAVYTGVSKRRTWTHCFVVNAMLAASAGILHALYLNGASTRDLQGKELIPIAIAVLGGTSLSGGYLSVWAVIAAGFFWGITELIGPLLPGYFPFAKSIEAYLGQILFYSMFIVISLGFGRLLAPAVPKIFARRED